MSQRGDTKNATFQTLNILNQTLNIVYPHEEIDTAMDTEIGDNININDIGELIGETGLKRVMDYDSKMNKYSYKREYMETIDRVFHPSIG